MSNLDNFLNYDKPAYSEMPIGEKSEQNPIPFLFHNFVNVTHLFSAKHFRKDSLTQVSSEAVKIFFSDLMNVLNKAEEMMKNGKLVQTQQANTNSLKKFKEFLEATSNKIELNDNITTEISFRYDTIKTILKEFNRIFRS